MDIVLVVLVVLAVGGLWGRSQKPAATRKARPTPRPAPAAPCQRPRVPQTSDVIGGWLIGHQIARGHDGFPGDPLPGGHLGSAANLAFWGAVFDEDEDDCLGC